MPLKINGVRHADGVASNVSHIIQQAIPRIFPSHVSTSIFYFYSERHLIRITSSYTQGDAANEIRWESQDPSLS